MCPACQSPFIKQLGLGTQRVEEEARALFPSARLLRLDSDTTSRKGAYEEIFRDFVAGKADILIGTQIVAKGLDIPRVTLVGVLAADSAFNLPDYRSSERGFQLLTQVSGRAGRGLDAGQVVLQTYSLDLPALTLARKQDYLTFAQTELAARKVFEYPPYSQIIRAVVSGEIESQVESACERLAEELSQNLDENFTEDQIKIVGPAPCLIPRLRGKYRHHLIVKNLAGEAGRKAVTGFLKLHRSTATLNLAVDVDAVDLV
jgi:primosomal protein N' (replication factor Y) (superfamily II helicase)